MTYRLLLDQLRVLSQNVIQPLPLQTPFECKALRDILYFRPVLALEMVRPLLHQKLGHQDTPRQPSNAVTQLPHRGGVELLVFLRGLLENMVDERLVDVLHGARVCAPCVDGETVFLREELLEELHVGGLGVKEHHALEPDVLVQPNRPAQTILVVDLELVGQDFIARLVDGVCGLSVVLLPGVHWSKLAIPDAETSLVHPFSLLLVAPAQATFLLVSSGVRLCGGGESEAGVIVDGVRGVLPAGVRIAKVREVGGECVTVEEDSMVWVNGTDGGVDAVVEADEACVGVICGLVQWVVPCDPFVVLVMSSEFLPEPNGAVLEVFVVPD